MDVTGVQYSSANTTVEAAFSVSLDGERRALQWQLNTPDGPRTFREEPDTTWWQRALLGLIGPFVPEGDL